MDLIKHSILGIIQGITEALPVSSSGHIFLFKNLFNFLNTKNINFEIIINFGSLLAILIIYRKEILVLIKEFFLYIKTKEKKYKSSFYYALFIVLATIPAGIVGLFFKNCIERFFSFKMLGVSFLITSAFLFISRKKDGQKKDKDITIRDSIIIGCFQAFALLPGISRSGITLSSALSRDINRESSLKFSFMLYIPISLAALVLGIKDLSLTIVTTDVLHSYLIAMLISTLGTYLMFNFFKKLFINKKINLIYFSIYTFILGLIILFIL